ncbi:MAG TPA: AraC family transcriptional regulator [Candidatus Binatia bacterium]|nr:AraC family transcriptional regulator [Candidatus Binatia bacterium]
MDALSEVLRIIQIESAFFYHGEFTAPWSFRSPQSSKLAPYIDRPDGHVIVYHLLTEGRATAKLDDNTRLPLEAGDIVIFPHGDPHYIQSGDGCRPVDVESALQHIFADGLKLARMGGGGEVTRFVCGYMVCEPELSEVLLSGLPAVFKVNIRADESGRWLEESIRYSITQMGISDSGSKAVLGKLCETLFAETLRRYVAASPLQQRGWLAGVLDPEIGKVLGFMHREPATPWTVAQLAQRAGMSRSVLAARFRQYLGEPPVAYLTRWRLQLGARMLSRTSRSVARIAAEVGYESEAAFNRAFRRQFGHPPARYRMQAKKAAV